MRPLKMLTMAAITIFSVQVYAQDSTKLKTEQPVYSCPMHPNAKMDKTGKCPQCGMDMRSSHHKMKMREINTYTCPMHPDVKMDKPGKCPQCGMDLKASKKEMKMDEMKSYTCPMHPDVKMDKPGKCPKCGMDLVEKK